MPPIKFDDIPKVSKSVLDDDYQVSGHQLVGKNKTNLGGAVLTTTIDIGKDAVKTPAKLGWKFPKPFGVAGVSVDKLEMDKSGKYKLEVSCSKDFHKVPDLAMDFKTDMVNLAKATKSVTYTGVKDMRVSFETKPASPMDFTYDVTKAMGLATVGLKGSGMKFPDLGIRILSGPYFCSLLAKEKGKAITANLFYKVSDDLKVACTYQQGGKTSGNYSAGIAYALSKTMSMKAKMAQDMSVCASVKYELAKGLTVLAGCKYAKDLSYGVKVSID
mmetsp:Transcript_79946/g.146197  ORF Transcript_79946/g.146197 Transcript_79946/m.146197 type:complete len:273 (-) Transcript_79946:116-934(-)